MANELQNVETIFRRRGEFRAGFMRYQVIILGAGPAGLGAGQRLHGEKRGSWKIFEASGRVGGLSSSRLDKNGFTWDIGGHVIFSGSAFFNALVEKTLGDDVRAIERKSYVKLGSRFIPFPFQNNIHRLPKKAMEECLAGMKKVIENKARPENFEQWIRATLGDGIAKRFMLPYNAKLWSFPLNKMGFGWIDGRVALPSIKSALRAIKTGFDETKWGPNATFCFPQSGGTGGLFRSIAQPFIKEISFRHEVVKIDTNSRKVFFKNGKSARYENLVTTLPLDVLVKKIIHAPPDNILRAASELRFNSGWIVGIGINRKIRTEKSWVYFPSASVPFYRVTVFSNYSPNNVPRPESQTSFLCETSFPETAKVSGKAIVDKTIEGLAHSGMMRRDDMQRIASRWKMKVPRLYPIPSLGRDSALKEIKNYLEKHRIYSVGRFGGWRYELGNMDHSFMAGYNLATKFSHDKQKFCVE